MECKTVFDIAGDGIRQIWVLPLIGLVLLVFSAECVVVVRNSERVWFAWLLVTLTAAFTIVSSALPLTIYMKGRRALSTGSYDKVEGRVEHFRPMPAGGHALERFTIRGEEFTYTDYATSPFFHQTRRSGGPVHDGVYLRVFHVDGDIIRLEVCTP